MACLCVLLGGPSCAADVESLFIDNATYYEPGVSGIGLTWTDADCLELNGYADVSIGTEGNLVTYSNPRVSNKWTSEAEKIVR